MQQTTLGGGLLNGQQQQGARGQSVGGGMSAGGMGGFQTSSSSSLNGGGGGGMGGLMQQQQPPPSHQQQQAQGSMGGMGMMPDVSGMQLLGMRPPARAAGMMPQSQQVQQQQQDGGIAFDMSEFPALSSRVASMSLSDQQPEGGGLGGATTSAAQALTRGNSSGSLLPPGPPLDAASHLQQQHLLHQHLQQPPQASPPQQPGEFAIQQEDFPALPGTVAPPPRSPKPPIVGGPNPPSSNHLGGIGGGSSISPVGGQQQPNNNSGSISTTSQQQQDGGASSNSSSSSGSRLGGGSMLLGGVGSGGAAAAASSSSSGGGLPSTSGSTAGGGGGGGGGEEEEGKRAAAAAAAATTTKGAEQYGLLGLLSVIRMTDPDLNTLALGSDLTTLGLNLNASESLYTTFASPWVEGPTNRDPKFFLPQCYNLQKQSLKLTHFSKFQNETLFYIFYAMPKDALQAYAAEELYRRDWRFHKEMKLWIKEEASTVAAPGPGLGGMTTTNKGLLQYWYFDINHWEKRLFPQTSTANLTAIASGLLTEEEVRMHFPAIPQQAGGVVGQGGPGAQQQQQR